MPDTYETVWRRVRLYVPGAPVFLVRTWVQDAYRYLCDKRQWGWTLAQGQLHWEASRSFACVTTRGSVTVSSAALFVAGDAGRQFRVGNYPIYTIQSVTSTSVVVLDQPYYGDTAGAVTGTVLDAYATMPVTFGAFQVIVDPTNQRFIPWWATQQELAMIDPTRSAADSVPRLLVASDLSTYPPTLGQVQYEYWPKPSAQGAFQYYASTRPAALADTTIFSGVLAHRPDVLEKGALAAAAKWPGTQDMKNPYFNLGLAGQLQQEFEALCVQLDIRDDDVYQQSWETIPWARFNGFTWAYNTHLLQATDADLGAYAGYVGGAGW